MRSTLLTGCIYSSVRTVGVFCLSLRANLVERLSTIECPVPWNWRESVEQNHEKSEYFHVLSGIQNGCLPSNGQKSSDVMSLCTVLFYQEEQESSSTVPVTSITTLGTRQMCLCVSAHKWQQSCWIDDTCCMQPDVWNTNFLGWRDCLYTRNACHDAWHRSVVVRN